MIYSFSEFLIESNGINNELKFYLNQIKLKFFSDFNTIKKDFNNKYYVESILTYDDNDYYVKRMDKIFIYNFDYSDKKLKIDTIKFNCIIYIGNDIERLNIKNNSFSIQDTDVVGNDSNDLIISPVINLVIIIDEMLLNETHWRTNGFMSSILHELQHVFQYWLLVINDADFPSTFHKALNINNWSRSLNDKDKKILYDLYHRLYLSRPHEVSARCVQLYEILKNCSINNIESLITVVKQSNEWKLSKYIEMFDHNIYLDYLKNNYTLDEIIKLISNIINILKRDDFADNFTNTVILTYDEIKGWLNKLEKYFKDLSPKIQKKLIKIAYEVYDDNKLKLGENNKFYELQ